jgi:selenocysteine lyase/cysteine desulfurase
MLEDHFLPFRKNIIGINQKFISPFGNKKIIYADWTASGRMYRPIEDILCNEIAPYVANTHTETSYTGTSMTLAYKKAKGIIKQHVNAKPTDILISSNSGMTGVVNKFQRILGFRLHEKYLPYQFKKSTDQPIIFVSHMEHHSNQTSWLETIAKVEIIQADDEGKVDLNHFRALLEKYKEHKTKIAAVTSYSNVTGVSTPYYEISRMIHEEGGYCFVDFACSAPYVDIDMHPKGKPQSYLDAIYFSPHKFLGGPGSSGILIFNQSLYKNKIPDNPGGGTVDWTNPWGEHKYHEEIEAREDGGTPSFLQTMKVALCIKLKEEMGVQSMLVREKFMVKRLFDELSGIPNLHILADNLKERLGVFSFYIDDLHYNLGVKVLNDRYGVQVRGGCSCAGTYGHYLLHVSYQKSKSITDQISMGDNTHKPGWIRLSIHPTMTDEELEISIKAIKELAENFKLWAEDYHYDSRTNEFYFKDEPCTSPALVESWFNKSLC